MSARPFDVATVGARLQPLVQAGTLRLVGYRADYAGVLSLQDYPAPCVYLLLSAERGQAAKTGAHHPGEQTPQAQLVPATFGVVHVARNHRRLDAVELRDELAELVGATRNRLLGWTPDLPGARACQLTAGDLDDYDEGAAIWTDVYATQHLIQPEISA